jgi:DNA-binding SARP family transcriptional activator/tetratricopeptide (TPR) repeat protein
VGAGAGFSILGPFEVQLDGGGAVALGGLRQRALLAVLVVQANEVVSTDRLIDQLWADEPPATAAHTIQVFVSRLRRALGPAGHRLVTRQPGYVLEVGVDEIDAERCEHLYSGGCTALIEGDPARAAQLLRDAQALWRGSPLADFTYEPFAQATIARLEELRLSCRERLIDAQLALGLHATVVSDLEALVREHPFREGLRGQLMLALYRGGRQAEALDAYQQARQTLVEELGVEPGDGLRRLEQAILQQDSSLMLPASPATDKPPERPSSGERRPTQVSRAPGEPESLAVMRKTVTVVVARLTAASDVDAETARGLVADARRSAEAIVSRHGGAFVSGLGGEVVGLFGVPRTKEDDALRALRAADELGKSVTTLITESGKLAVGIGVDSGEVVGEAPVDLFGQPLGGAIGLARSAQDAEVLLSDATRRLASDALRVTSALDGGAWRLLGLITGAPAIERQHGIPMVNRQAELALASAAFRRAELEGNTHLLTLIGEAGIGKSRLALEVTSAVGDAATVLSGRCLSYGEGIALWPLREALTLAAGAETRDGLRGLLGDDEDADLVADIVATAFGIEPSHPGSGEQVPWAIRRLLEMLARDRPLMLVIDDAHWGEPALLDLMEYLLDWVTAPMLLVCLARPELLETRPRWGGGHPRVSSLVIGPLSDGDTLSLLHQQLGERSLSDAERARILDTAEGNPLFVEQLLATSFEDPWWDREGAIPPTIQSLLAARLDRLGPGERAVIERAAVMGRGFWFGAILELLPDQARASAEQHLRALVRRGLVQPSTSTLSGEEELRFRHILIRDVTYRGTSKALRGALHERFANWLEMRTEGYEEFVGYHLEQAFLYHSQLGHPDADLRVLAGRGSERLATAGRRGLARGETSAASGLLRRSVALAQASGRDRPDVLLDLGSALNESGEFDEAEQVLQLALERSRATQAEAVGARALIELSLRSAFVDPEARVMEMLRVAESAMTVFDRLNDAGGISRAQLHIAKAHWIRCRCAEMEEVLERALTHAESANDRHERSRILSELARATVIGPRPVDDGIRRCESILEGAGDDLALTAVTGTMLAVLEAMTGKIEDARRRWVDAKRRLDDVGLTVTRSALQMYCAFVELIAGEPERAEPELTEAYVALERIGERDRLATTAALLARVLYAEGRYEESGRYADITARTAATDDVVSQVLASGTRGKMLARAGQTLDAVKLVDSAVALANETDFLMLRGDALTDRADVLALLNRHSAAAIDLRRGIELYEAKGISVAAKAARESLRVLKPPRGAARRA